MTGASECRTLEQLAQEKERELEELRQRKAQATRETLKGTRQYMYTESIQYVCMVYIIWFREH